MFVLLGEVRYEGETLLGVYSTEELAERARDDYETGQSRMFHDYVIRPVTVDAPAEIRW